MSCHSCARTTLSLFIRSFSNAAIVTPRQTSLKIAQPSRFFTTARPPYKPDGSASQRSYRPQRTVSQHPYKHERPASQRSEDVIEDIIDEDAPSTRRERPAWAVQKAALKEKLGGEAWNPRKKLSPDTMEGIRHLHTTQPAKFTTPVLAEHFKVTPEAIRRILKSKWRPSDEEYEARMLRWNKRGERIWTDLVEMGVRPPKQWRDMGVGRATNGERPKWKSRPNMVHVRDSASDNFVIEEGEIIPVVDGSGKSKRAIDLPLSQRL